MKIFIPIVPESILKAVVVEICKSRVEGEGYDGDVMCPATIDNYARHVSATTNFYDILN